MLTGEVGVDGGEARTGVPARHRCDPVERDRDHRLATYVRREGCPVVIAFAVVWRDQRQLTGAEPELADVASECRHPEQRWQRRTGSEPRRFNVPDRHAAQADGRNEHLLIG